MQDDAYSINMLPQELQKEHRDIVEKISHDQDIETEEIRFWAKFDYALLKRTGWASRYDDKWSYEEDALWKREFSLEVSIDELIQVYNRTYLQSMRNLYIMAYRKLASGVLNDSVDNKMICSSFECLSSIPEIFNICLFDIEKTDAILDVNITGSSNKNLPAFSNPTSSQIILSALIGAIEVEHIDKRIGFDGSIYGEEEEGKLNDMRINPESRFAQFLVDLFSAESLLDESRNKITSDSYRCFDEIRSACLKIIDKKADSNGNPEKDVWKSEEIRIVKGDFCRFCKADIFRYFIKTYALKNAICVSVSVDDVSPHIKGSYRTTKNLAHKRGGKQEAISRLFGMYNPFSCCIPYSFPLDQVGIAEEEHFNIVAPKGTFFVPAGRNAGILPADLRKAKKAFWKANLMGIQGNSREQKEIDTSSNSCSKNTSNISCIDITKQDSTVDSVGGLQITANRNSINKANTMGDEACNSFIKNDYIWSSVSDIKKACYLGVSDDRRNTIRRIKNQSDAEQTKFRGMLSPKNIILESRKSWEKTGDAPHRRFPIGTSVDHNYSMIFGISPRLGLRSVGYCAYFLLVTILFWICVHFPEIYNLESGKDEGSDLFSVSSILLLASIIVMVVANRESDSDIRKKVFSFPRWITNASVLYCIFGFVVFFLVCQLSLNNKYMPSNLLYILLGSTDVELLKLKLVSLAEGVAQFGFYLNFVLAVICVIWCLKNKVVQTLCTCRKDSYEFFDIQFHTRSKR